MSRGTWNIAEVELVETRRTLRMRMAEIATLWAAAFALVVVGSLIGLGVAEAAPTGRLGGVMPGPGAPALLAGIATGSGAVATILWKRIASSRRK